MLLSLPILAQDITISGQITSSDDNVPIPGVSVQLKGTTRGTVTDAAGKYQITSSANGRLVYSFIGYGRQEVAVNNRTTIDISLAPDVSNLNEVVVTTFGNAKREAFTGSAATISAAKISDRPITNLAQALSGAAPGVQTTAGSGQPGSAPDIRIRGFGSISSSNDPLYVVDGVPYTGSIANISPNDIESITVLKDAASTALYGARAANGVIVVTTKKGKKDRSQISVRYTKGANSRGLPEYDRVGVSEYYPLMWETYRNSVAYRATNPLSLSAANADATSRLLSLVGYNVYDVPGNQLVNTDGQFNPNAKLLYSPDDLNWEKPITRRAIGKR